MKTQLKILKPLTGSIFVFLLIFFTNCNDAPCPYESGYNTIHYTLSEDTLKIPYNGYDSLTFLRITPTKTDTIIYKGQGKHYYDERKYEYVEGSICDDEYVYDGYVINFVSKQSPDKIYFLIQMFTDKSAEFFVHYKDRKFYDLAWTIDNPFFQPYYYSIILEHIYFTDVIPVFPIKDFGGYDMSRYDTIYFNSTYGIVRIALDSSTTSLTLIK